MHQDATSDLPCRVNTSLKRDEGLVDNMTYASPTRTRPLWTTEKKKSQPSVLEIDQTVYTEDASGEIISPGRKVQAEGRELL